MQDAISAMTRQLSALRAVLKKAEDHCATRKIDPAVMLGSRLFPDMFPLSRQVQIACDHAKGAAHRLAGREVPSMPDTETTFAELRDRIDRTVALIGELPGEAYEGADQRTVVLKMRSGEMSFTGRDYLWNFALPNLYFHAAAAYNILRHNGVELGKRDFLGAS
jgi:uncharacterized protein